MFITIRSLYERIFLVITSCITLYCCTYYDQTKIRQKNNCTHLGKLCPAIQDEINKLQNEKNSVFCQAGMKAYNSWYQGETDTSSLSAFWNKVIELDQAIKEKEEKKAEMVARYDEEINLIQSNISISMAAANSGKVCPSCKAVIKESDLFCEKCGTRVG